MRQFNATEHEIPKHCACFTLSWGERAWVRASFSSNLIFGVRGGFWREEDFRLVTSAAMAVATILELTLRHWRTGLVQDHSGFQAAAFVQHTEQRQAGTHRNESCRAQNKEVRVLMVEGVEVRRPGFMRLRGA